MPTTAFAAADTSSQNTNQRVPHECKIQVSGGSPAMLWEGELILEQSLMTTMV